MMDSSLGGNNRVCNVCINVFSASWSSLNGHFKWPNASLLQSVQKVNVLMFNFTCFNASLCGNFENHCFTKEMLTL